MAINGIKMMRNKFSGFKRFYDFNSGETVHVAAPIFRKSTFGSATGGTGAAAVDSTNLWVRSAEGHIWKLVDFSTTSSPTIAVTADTPPGQLTLTTQATVNEASDLALSYGDELLVDPNKYLNGEFVITPHTNLNNAAANRYAYICGFIFGNWTNSATTVFGPLGATIKRAVWKLTGNAGDTTLTLAADVGDGTTVTTAAHTTTVAADTQLILRIDMSDLTDVKFMLNGNRVFTDTSTTTTPQTFNLSALAATDYGQPIVASCRSSTVIATAQVLYAQSAAIWQAR